MKQTNNGSLTCAQIWVRAVHTKGGQAQISLHKSWLRETEKRILTLPLQGIEPRVFGFEVQLSNHWATSLLLLLLLMLLLLLLSLSTVSVFLLSFFFFLFFLFFGGVIYVIIIINKVIAIVYNAVSCIAWFLYKITICAQNVFFLS